MIAPPPQSSSAGRRQLLSYLRKGRVVTRDDHGGAIGVRWTTATRDGRSFSTRAAERLLTGGCKLGGVRHVLTAVAEQSYRLEEETA